jgi:hypothetical protein
VAPRAEDADAVTKRREHASAIRDELEFERAPLTTGAGALRGPPTPPV